MDDVTIDSAIILEYEYLFEHFQDMIDTLLSTPDYAIPKLYATQIRDHLSTLSPYEYAAILLMTFPEPRLNYYKDPDYNKLLESPLGNTLIVGK